MPRHAGVGAVGGVGSTPGSYPGPSNVPPNLRPIGMELPPDYPMITTRCLHHWLSKNDPFFLKKERDKVMGWRKYLSAIITMFFFLAPIIVIVNDLAGSGAVLIFLWIPIGILFLCYFEFYHRLEVWWILISRGLILVLDEGRWWLSFPFFVALFFIVLTCVMVGVATSDWLQGLLFLPTMLFTIYLVADFVQIEENGRIATINCLLGSLGNPNELEPYGFKCVHRTQLLGFINVWKKQSKVHGAPFTWDLVYQLSHSADKTKKRFIIDWIWGTRTRFFLGPLKNLDPGFYDGIFYQPADGMILPEGVIVDQHCVEGNQMVDHHYLGPPPPYHH